MLNNKFSLHDNFTPNQLLNEPQVLFGWVLFVFLLFISLFKFKLSFIDIVIRNNSVIAVRGP